MKQLNQVYEALDELRKQRMNASLRTWMTVPRVDLERVDVNPPQGKVFPFMIDEIWYEDHVAGTTWEAKLDVHKLDPKGFGQRQNEE